MVQILKRSAEVYSVVGNGSSDDSSNQVKLLQREFNTIVVQMCSKLQLSPEIEFFCMDSFDLYIGNVFKSLTEAAMERINGRLIGYSAGWQQTSKDVIDQITEQLEKETLLRVLSLISISAKYIEGCRWAAEFRFMQNMLQQNGTPYTFREMLKAEFEAFRNIDYVIKRSDVLRILCSILQICRKSLKWNTEKNDAVYKVAIAIHRMVYLERDSIYGRIHSKNNSREFLSDKVLLNVAVIHVTGFIMNFNELEGTQLLDLLSFEINYTKSDILTLSDSILKRISDDE